MTYISCMAKVDPIKTRRTALGLTQREVASRAGLALSHYQAIEQGRTVPSVWRAQALAAVLGTTIEKLWPLGMRSPETTEGDGEGAR